MNLVPGGLNGTCDISIPKGPSARSQSLQWSSISSNCIQAGHEEGFPVVTCDGVECCCHIFEDIRVGRRRNAQRSKESTTKVVEGTLPLGLPPNDGVSL